MIRPKILYIMSSYNIYGGTPKKTLDLMKYFGENSVIYVYDNIYSEFKYKFEETGGKVYEGFYGKNIFNHTRHLIQLIDKKKINIVQTQFFWGELLGLFIKIFRPDIKLVVAFVGSIKLSPIKSILATAFYRISDHVVYISKYVKTEKEKQFPILKTKNSVIIYNGTEKRNETSDSIIKLGNKSILDIAGLIELKNIQILIKAFNIIINHYKKKDYYLYVVGDGPYRSKLEKMIDEYKLHDYAFLLGYQKNVGKLLNSCDIFVHPSFAEGFGIVVPEAMLAQKPVIVSNAGALPELIEHKKTGLIVESHNPEDWANAIIQLAENPEFAEQLAKNAEKSASERFSYNKFCGEYEKLYKKLLKINY
jgi:L-malate glycosyltransferase